MAYTENFSLEGKIALITGASYGIGYAIAKGMAKAGAKIVFNDIKQEFVDKGLASYKADGIDAAGYVCDVTDEDAVNAMVAQIEKEIGVIDILVNNAGIGTGAPAEMMEDSTWDSTIRINLSGVYYVAREVGKVMIEQNYGKIINLGSIHSTVAMMGSPISAYCASKGGVEMLTKALANEWAKYNITVNAIGPAYFESEMTDMVINTPEFGMALQAYCPMGRAGRPGELDGALIYFASDASSYTTGQLLTVDGGWTAI
jgi:gluconate 5-dehydrogenase